MANVSGRNIFGTYIYIYTNSRISMPSVELGTKIK